MKSSRVTFALSLLLSALVHATLFYTLRRGAVIAAPVRRTVAQAYRVAPPGTLPDPLPKFGEHKADGESINSSPGDEPQTALKSRPDQAALSRDPTGQVPGASPGTLGRPVTAPPPSAVPTPPLSAAPAFRKPTKPAPPSPQETPPKPPSPQSAAQPGTAGGGRPTPQSDRDSDLFAKETSVEFKRGRVAARKGREVKFARPRDNLAAMVDAAEITFPARLKLKISIDASGHVRNAYVLDSTGSRSIDRAFVLAAFESWFEPSKDAAGKPVGDDFDFVLTLE